MDKQPKRPYRRAEETREHVLDVADRLFHANGIRAVGVDRLAVEARVTTATLYRLFESKDALVAAYLRRADRQWFAWLDGTTAESGLPRFFDELDERARDADYRGCPFRMALAEYSAVDSEINRIAIDNKRRTYERFRDLAIAARLKKPDVTAEQLLVVMEGICATAVDRNPDSPPSVGPQLARLLLAGAASNGASARRT